MKQGHLKPGEKAPAFETHDWQDNRIEPFGHTPGRDPTQFFSLCILPTMQPAGARTDHYI
jgi:hypothetical protein